MEPITIKGDTYRVSIYPERFFPTTNENLKKFIKSILRPTYGNESDYLRECIEAIDDLISEIPQRYEDEISKIKDSYSKTAINEIKAEANRIKREGEKLKRNREDLKKELEAII